MDQHLKRLLVIAVLVSFIFSSSAYNYAASTEEDNSTDIQNRSNCNAVTHLCNVPKPDPIPTTAAVTEQGSQDSTEFETSPDHHERICIPGTPECIEQKHDPKPTKEGYNVASTEEDTSTDFQTESNCIPDPVSHMCHAPTPDSRTTIEDVTEEDSQDTTNFEPSKDHNEEVCIPGRPVPHEPTKEAVTDEAASKVKSDTICNPLTRLCQGQYIGNTDTVTCPVESSMKENASISEDRSIILENIICDFSTGRCNVPVPASVITEPTEGDLPKPDISKFERNPVYHIVCNPKTHKCHGPKPQLVVSEYGKATQMEDSVIPEEQNGFIITFACTTNPDGSRTCRTPHRAFGLARPSDATA